MSAKTTTVSRLINVPKDLAFKTYLDPEANLQWNYASEGWSTPFARIDAKVGGVMEIGYRSADGQFEFTLEGKFTEIVENEKIVYVMSDGREVVVSFEDSDGQTKVSIELTLEETHTEEQQREGWGMILQHFETYVLKVANPERAVIKKSIIIKANAEKVWQTLLDDESYRIWTEPFCEGSYYESELKLGAKILFKSPQGGGLSSRIVTFIPNYQVSFEHLGFLAPDGKEDFDSEEVLGWKGCRETYTLNEDNGVTKLDVYCEINKKEFTTFDEMWSKAVEKVKVLAEA